MSQPREPLEPGSPGQDRVKDLDLVPVLSIGEPSEPTSDTAAAALATAEAEDLAIQRKLITTRIKGEEQDIGERKIYASRIFWLMLGWLAALFVLLFIAGWRLWGFELPTPVLLAIVGGTTANVLGIFVFVARYLFWKKGPPT